MRKSRQFYLYIDTSESERRSGNTPNSLECDVLMLNSYQLGGRRYDVSDAGASRSRYLCVLCVMHKH